jgi:hypothetical protein
MKLLKDNVFIKKPLTLIEDGFGTIKVGLSIAIGGHRNPLFITVYKFVQL